MRDFSIDNLEKLKDAFLDDRRSRFLSVETLKYYRQELRFFVEFCSQRGVERLQDVSSEMIRAHLTSLADRGRNRGGVHAAYRALRAWFLWMWQEYEYAQPNPINRVKVEQAVVEPLPAAKMALVMKLVGVCGGRNGARDKAIFMMLADSGLRANELLSLRIGDVDWATGAVKVLRGKGQKFRVTFVGNATLQALRAYVKDRTVIEEDPLFASNWGERLTLSGLRNMIARRAEVAGVKPPPLHSFRRLFALSMVESGCDLATLQKFLGHSSLAVTQRYLGQDLEELQAKHRRHSPIDRAKQGE